MDYLSDRSNSTILDNTGSDNHFIKRRCSLKTVLYVRAVLRPHPIGSRRVLDITSVYTGTN